MAMREAIVHSDDPSPSSLLYADSLRPEDRADIPAFDLPAGIPSWMYADDGWARRVGDTAQDKRRNITITVPAEVVG